MYPQKDEHAWMTRQNALSTISTAESYGPAHSQNTPLNSNSLMSRYNLPSHLLSDVQQLVKEVSGLSQ